MLVVITKDPVFDSDVPGILFFTGVSKKLKALQSSRTSFQMITASKLNLIVRHPIWMKMMEQKSTKIIDPTFNGVSVWKSTLQSNKLTIIILELRRPTQTHGFLSSFVLRQLPGQPTLTSQVSCTFMSQVTSGYIIFILLFGSCFWRLELSVYWLYWQNSYT